MRTTRQLNDDITEQIISLEKGIHTPVIDNNTLTASMVITKTSETFIRDAKKGFYERSTTPLMVYPAQSDMIVCHMLPFLYTGIENDSYLMFGSTHDINQAMRYPERELTQLLNKHTSVYYKVDVSVTPNHHLNVHISIVPITEHTPLECIDYTFQSQLFYIFDTTLNYTRDDLANMFNQSDIVTDNTAFLEQWYKYETTLTLNDNRVIKGIQVTTDTFIDKNMNAYYNESDTTILDELKSYNFIYSEYLTHVLDLEGIVGYVDSMDNKIVWHIIEDKYNTRFSLYPKLFSYMNTFHLSEIIKDDDYTYTLYRADTSRIFKHTWQLKAGECVNLDEQTMTVFPAEREDGHKRPICFENSAGLLITGQTGSGKTESVKTMVMPFIQSNYADVSIIDMKQSFDWVIFEPYIDLLLNNRHVEMTAVYYLIELYQEIRVRNQMLKSKKMSNFWDIPKDERPFNFKLIIIDEIHELMNFSFNITKRNKEYSDFLFPSYTLHYILRTARNVGIFILGITQTSTRDSLGSTHNNLSMFNHRIHFRNKNEATTYHLSEELRERLNTIPNDDKGIGVALIEGQNNQNNDTSYIRFGYYPDNTLIETLKTFKRNNEHISVENNSEDEEYISENIQKAKDYLSDITMHNPRLKQLKKKQFLE